MMAEDDYNDDDAIVRRDDDNERYYAVSEVSRLEAELDGIDKESTRMQSLSTSSLSRLDGCRIKIKLNSIKDAMHNVHCMLGAQVEVVDMLIDRGGLDDDDYYYYYYDDDERPSLFNEDAEYRRRTPRCPTPPPFIEGRGPPPED